MKDSSDDSNNYRSKTMVSIAPLFLCFALLIAQQSCIIQLIACDLLNHGKRGDTIIRSQTDYDDIINSLGPIYSRRSYRMPPSHMDCLYQRLKYNIPPVGSQGPNGMIPGKLRLSAAIRYFAGASPYDIMLTHGISHSVLYLIIDAIIISIHQTLSLNISFPQSYSKQEKIAMGFPNNSEDGFNTCVNAIDGMLI